MWQVTLPDGTVATESSVRHGEHQAVFALVAESIPTHREIDVHPAHCPVCRTAVLAVLAATRCRRDMQAEVVRLCAMSRDEVLSLVTVARPGLVGEG